jgi:hypothetical protein
MTATGVVAVVLVSFSLTMVDLSLDHSMSFLDTI